MSKPVKLSVVRSERKREEARAVRKSAHQRFRDISDDYGDELTGYVLVAWDSKGWLTSTVYPGGPFPSRTIPAVVSEALSQHVTSNLAESEIHKMLWPGK